MATDENVPRSGRPASDDGRLLEAKTHIARLTAQNESLSSPCVRHATTSESFAKRCPN